MGKTLIMATDDFLLQRLVNEMSNVYVIVARSLL